MLKNFQLTAIVKHGPQVKLLRIPLHQELQQSLAESWQGQLDAFLKDVHEIDFNAGYQPEEHERFRLNEYEPPVWLAGENSHSVGNLNPITSDGAVMDSIRGIAAFARDAKGHEVVLFQNFSRSHVIQPGRFLFLRNDTYETAERPGLTLDSKLAAVYKPADRKLLFHSFRTVNTFLPLADFYEEASEQQIRTVLKHGRLEAEDADALAAVPTSGFANALRCCVTPACWISTAPNKSRRGRRLVASRSRSLKARSCFPQTRRRLRSCFSS